MQTPTGEAKDQRGDRTRVRRLLAAVLVVSVLAPPGLVLAICPPTDADALGPFYVPGAPERNKTGDGFAVRGVVRSTTLECKGLPAATVEWWSANAHGEYDAAHRATQVTDSEGRFRYVTDMPGMSEGRPAPLYVKVSAPGHRTLVTRIYPKTIRPQMEFDLFLQRE